MKTLTAALLLFSVTFICKGQQRPDSLTTGFWVVESNINTRRTQVVKFYDAQHNLVYEERIEGRRLKYESPKIQKKLNEVLATILSGDLKTQEKSLLAATVRKKLFD